MKVYVAEHSGFCKGVEHAVNTALSLEKENAYIILIASQKASAGSILFC